MKLNPVSLFSALLLTLAMSVVVFLFDYYHAHFNLHKAPYTLLLLLTIALIFALNYSVLQYLFKYYVRKELRKFTNILPEEISHQDLDKLGFKELGERISVLNERNISEMDMMKEMELYRKEYIGNVSHELKTPLFSIQGYVETLMDGGIENLAIRDKYLERISKSVERLLTIVTDLDMIGQYESGEIHLSLRTFDIHLLIKEIVELFDLEAQKKDARIFYPNITSPLFVTADRPKIAQVLTNLIANAIHYSNREKAVINISTKYSDKQVFVEIRDNGMGIKPEILPRIFERFYRAESSRNRRDGGSGLGLAIVKHILEAHHQNIVAESVYLEGTTFTFSLEKAT